TEGALVRVEADGRVTAALGTHSQGQGTETTVAQIIADRLGGRFADAAAGGADAARAGCRAGSGGTRQAAAGGGAVLRAAERPRDEVKALAAHLLNASEEAVRVEDGMIHVDGAPEMTRSLREIAAVAYGEPARLPPGM